MVSNHMKFYFAMYVGAYPLNCVYLSLRTFVFTS